MSLTSFFLNSRADVIQYETLEIYHPNFSQTYRLVRNAVKGLTATLETAAVVTFDYRPLNISLVSSFDSLDNSLKIELGDLGEIVPIELDLVKIADGFLTKPILTYRVYRSDELTTPLYGPFVYEITTFNQTVNGCNFEAKPPALNVTKTGIIYSIADFPALEAFV